MCFQAPKAQHKQCVSIVGFGVNTPSGCGRQMSNVRSFEKLDVVLLGVWWLFGFCVFWRFFLQTAKEFIGSDKR